MSYSQALEQQLAMLDWVERRGYGDQADDVISQVTSEQRSAASELIAATLADADPYYWSPEICEILEATAPSIPPWSLRPEDLLTRTGFCWLARPLKLPSPKPTDVGVPMVAFSWLSHEEGIYLSTYLPDPRKLSGVPTISGHWRYGQSHEQMLADLQEIAYQKSIDSEMADLYRRRATLQLQYVAAGIAFMLQKIFHAHSEQAPRQTRKRALASLPHAPLIRVVELRRVRPPEQTRVDHDPVEWSCRWIVEGHWREQYYPSTGEHRPLFILPYVKGPEDRPLKPPRAKVFAVVR